MDPNASLTAVASAPAPDFFFSALLSAGSLALAGLTWALTHLGLWASTRIKDEKVKAIWLRADDYAVRAVKDVFQAYVEPLKQAGKWDDNSAATAKRMAVDKVKEMLSWQHGVQALSYIFSGNSKALDEFVNTFVESAVLDVKRDGATVGALLTAPSAPPPQAPAPPNTKPALRADGSAPAPNPTPAPAGL